VSHHKRIVAIWLVSSAVAVPLIIFVLGKHLPPGTMSTEATDQRDANTRLTALMAPIVLAVLLGFGYSLVAFRARGRLDDGLPIFGHGPTQTVWLIATSAIVVGLAAWGSWTLIVSSHGAGGGQGPNPIALPKDYKQALQVQVIGQQWNWTYRFPSYGGLETDHLELPVGTDVELHVTSLDVTHSFWAYQLGVKADAVPGADNIAFVHPRRLGTFSIRCSELCGLWHGHMYQTGAVVTPKAFAVFIKSEQGAELPNLRYLPPDQKTYYPEPLRRAG
jgi:cytochrome c oxidase subunit 2